MALLRTGTAGDYVLEDSGLLDRDGMRFFEDMYVAETMLASAGMNVSGSGLLHCFRALPLLIFF